jgi:DNA-binding transcriptional ArsR family regulator
MSTDDATQDWRHRVERARSLIDEHGTVAAAVAHLRGVTTEPGVLEPLIPILHERGFTGREIADRLGISQARVSRRLKTLVALGLAEPVDKSRGGGGNRPPSSPQVKAARAYRNAVLMLLASNLSETPSEDRAEVRRLVGDTHNRLADILARWSAEG